MKWVGIALRSFAILMLSAIFLSAMILSAQSADANSSDKITTQKDQAEGETKTQTGVGKDKMGVCEKVLCLNVAMVISCSSNVNSCPNASEYTLAAQPQDLADPATFQGKSPSLPQVVFFQLSNVAPDYSITVTNAPPNGGKIQYNTYCKGGLVNSVNPPNTCTVTAEVS
jgi:hypothetical protein